MGRCPACQHDMSNLLGRLEKLEQAQSVVAVYLEEMQAELQLARQERQALQTQLQLVQPEHLQTITKTIEPRLNSECRATMGENYADRSNASQSI